jgi:hypothetical protein
MPTPKQVRYHYGRIMRAWDRLDEALRHAHIRDVIVYSGWDGVAPCQSHMETEERIKKTCEKQLAKAMHSEIVTKPKRRK